MLVLFHLLKTYIRNPFIFISFLPSHLQGNADDNHNTRAHICAWGGEFCPVSIFAWFAKLLEVNFLVLLKLDGCQIDLPNCWSCS
jgi:hypothetical protein